MTPPEPHPSSPIPPPVFAAGRLQPLIERTLTADNGDASWIRYLKATGVTAVITLAGALLNLRVSPTNLAMLYLVGMGLVSYRWGLRPAIASSLISAFTFNFFFIPPYESFAITDFWYFITAVTFMCVALCTSMLVRAVRQHVLIAERRARQTAALYALMQSLAPVRRPSEVLETAATHIRIRFGLDTAILLANETGQLETQFEPAGSRIEASLYTAAEEVFTAARNSSIRREGRFVLLRTAKDVMGVIVLMPGQDPPAIGSVDAIALEAMAEQVALAIQRAVLEDKARGADREQRRAEQVKTEAIATLATGLAHNLNNLLTGILGAASLAADILPRNHPSRELLNSVATSGQRAAHIVAQVLAYAGKGRFLNEVVDLSELVRAFLTSLPPPPVNIELSVKLAECLPGVEADRNQLLQLIGNLYINAMEAIDQAHGKIIISTYLGSSRKSKSICDDQRSSSNTCVYLSVTDTGCGIEESIRPRIFDPFFTTKFIGRGLGLAASQGIMRAHNGVIQVSSEPGKGSTFTCIFPVATSHNHSDDKAGGMR